MKKLFLLFISLALFAVNGVAQRYGHAPSASKLGYMATATKHPFSRPFICNLILHLTGCNWHSFSENLVSCV